jgi:nucleotide-binding universal stress UspA family protein
VIGKIVVPLDGSELAERALPYALGLARAANATVTLVRAAVALPLPGFDAWESVELAQEEARKDLEEIAVRARTTGIPIETHTVFGEPSRVIQEVVEDRGADLVVMSTHGRSGLGRWFYGSVVDQFLRRTTRPVLLVPASCWKRWPEGDKFRVLVPLDGSDLSEEALAPAAELAHALGGKLVLVRVLEPKPEPRVAWLAGLPIIEEVDADIERRVEDARIYLREVADRNGAADHVADLIVEEGNPDDLIAQVARDVGAHAIVMATHGRTGLARVVVGSVALATLQRACVPVLMVRPTTMVHAPSEPAAVRARTTGATTTPSTAATTITLTAEESRAMLYGLELLSAALDRGTPDATTARTLIDRLQALSMGRAVPANVPPAQPARDRPRSTVK